MIDEYMNGVVGGYARAIIGHPFDTVKTKMQVNPLRYGNSTNCLRMTIKEEGWLSLYKGLTAPLLANGFIVGTHFSVFKMLKDKIENSFIRGAIAGSVASFIACPVEFLRIKMQLASRLDNNKNYKNILECAKAVIDHKGTLGIFTGQRVTLLRDALGYGCFFFAYANTPDLSSIVFVNKILKGILCGFGLWGSMYPIDVIKSRIQGALLENQKKTEICWTKEVYTQLGIKGFYKGFGATMVRAIPVNIGIVLTVDYFHHVIRN